MIIVMELITHVYNELIHNTLQPDSLNLWHLESFTIWSLAEFNSFNIR